MSYKAILQILLILAIISTLCICIMKPKMHKSVLVYNSDYVLSSSEEYDMESEKIPVMEMSQEPLKESAKVEEVIETVDNKYIQPEIFQNKVEQPISKKTVTQSIPSKITERTPSVQKVTKVEPKQESQKVLSSSPAINLDKIVNNNKIIQNTPKVESANVSSPIKGVTESTKSSAPIKIVPLPNSTASSKTVEQAPKPKILTAQEEEIAWNVWRSNLQNQIMRDVKLPILPQGTKFNYTFNVDKYGKITNVKTYAVPSNYTPYAIQYIAPVIRSYQGRSILNYPEGTQRTMVEAYGAWKISTSSKYSTPQDYNDVEKVIK